MRGTTYYVYLVKEGEHVNRQRRRDGGLGEGWEVMTMAETGNEKKTSRPYLIHHGEGGRFGRDLESIDNIEEYGT